MQALSIASLLLYRKVSASRGRQRPIILHDAGGWFVFLVLFGLPGAIGLVIDYFWNLLALTLSLKWVGFRTETRKKAVVCLFMTCLGLIIDWFYYMFMWGGGLFFPPPVFSEWGTKPFIEVMTILIPIFVLSVEYYILNRYYFRTNHKQALVAGSIMGFMTAPWLIIVFVLIRGAGYL